ncbi:MAG: glycosyltransferase, partial [Chloroflexota bacterium]
MRAAAVNEETTLPAVIGDIPRRVPGFDVVEILVVDDGSTDRTSAVAREFGVDHILSFTRNRGLGHALRAGWDFCLAHG